MISSLPLAPTRLLAVNAPAVAAEQPTVSAIRTDGVYVIFTTVYETVAAARVARDLARAMDARLTLVHFRTVPFQLPVDAPAGVSPLETEDFIRRLRLAGIDAHLRVFLCRNETHSFPLAFRPHSLVVVAGRRHRWPSRTDRWRAALESAGHFVLFVNTDNHTEATGA